MRSRRYRTQSSLRYPLGASYLSKILLRRLLTSSSARFWLEQCSPVGKQVPCELLESAREVLAPATLGQEIFKSSLFT